MSVEMSTLPVLKLWSIMVSRGAAQARSSLLNLTVFPGVFYRFDLQFWLKIYFLIFGTTEKETLAK